MNKLGFTLVEILVAAALFIGCLSFSVWGVKQASRLLDRGEELAKTTSELRTVMEGMTSGQLQAGEFLTNNARVRVTIIPFSPELWLLKVAAEHPPLCLVTLRKVN